MEREEEITTDSHTVSIMMSQFVQSFVLSGADWKSENLSLEVLSKILTCKKEEP